jgi:microcin C transport system substrate-binding protein
MPPNHRDQLVTARLETRKPRAWLMRPAVWLLALAGIAASAVSSGNAADAPIKRHALSLVGAPKYGADFKHFDWVNPEAPKGGRVREYASGSFDTLNQFPVQGDKAAGLIVLYDTLFAQSLDEPSVSYGLVASWVSYAADFTSISFGLRPEARFHDGKPITPEDVIFSFNELKKHSATYSTYYKDIASVAKTGEREVTFTAAEKNNRELPSIVSDLPILPKHWWSEKRANGEPRDVGKSSLEVPLGSGPYKIKSFEAGRTIVYERAKDWWAKDLPVAKGQHNFDELVFIYFRDRQPGFEAFKVGQVDYWRENSAKSWVTEYDFPSVKSGFIKRDQIKISRVAPAQTFALNQRRKVFADIRVRRALTLAFDFEWANANIFSGLYTRLNSYFDNSELAATGLPTGKELEILETVRASVPAEVFTTEFKNPVNSAPADARRNLGQAAKLLADAGYVSKSGVMTNAKGETLAIELLLDDPRMMRIALPYQETLEKLGIKLTIRQVDSAQYQSRLNSFDYDMIIGLYAQSISPGNEQREFWGSAAADIQGSRNELGIKNPAIDALNERIVFAKDRAELVAATRALDRVLLWNFYSVLLFHNPEQWIAHWDRFGRPAKLPSQAASFRQVWWLDAEASAKLDVKRGTAP